MHRRMIVQLMLLLGVILGTQSAIHYHFHGGDFDLPTSHKGGALCRWKAGVVYKACLAKLIFIRGDKERSDHLKKCVRENRARLLECDKRRLRRTRRNRA